MSKIILASIISAYIGAGLFGGLVMQAAVPAMNYKGVAYYAATWPLFLHCAREEATNCNPLTIPPMWLAVHLFDLEKDDE